MKDHKDNHPERKKKVNLDEEIDSGITKDFDDINSADSGSTDNVVSNARSELQNRKHGRSQGDPITGSTPKTD